MLGVLGRCFVEAFEIYTKKFGMLGARSDVCFRYARLRIGSGSVLGVGQECCVFLPRHVVCVYTDNL